MTDKKTRQEKDLMDYPKEPEKKEVYVSFSLEKVVKVDVTNLEGEELQMLLIQIGEDEAMKRDMEFLDYQILND